MDRLFEVVGQVILVARIVALVFCTVVCVTYSIVGVMVIRDESAFAGLLAWFVAAAYGYFALQLLGRKVIA